jgi:hypothetical protein
MRAVFIILLSQLLLSCTSLGSKQVLLIDKPSDWKIETLSSQESYFYSCKGLSVYVDEVAISKSTYAFGPIIPVIPSNLTHNFEENNLKLIVSIFGLTEKNNYDANSSSVSIRMRNVLVDLKRKNVSIIHEEKKESGKLWIQYSMSFSYKTILKDIDKLDISFDLPMFPCEIPHLLLHREKVNDNSFTIAPGI